MERVPEHLRPARRVHTVYGTAQGTGRAIAEAELALEQWLLARSAPPLNVQYVTQTIHEGGEPGNEWWTHCITVTYADAE